MTRAEREARRQERLREMAGRQFSRALEERAQQAELALRDALHGRPGWVEGRALRRAWDARFGPAPANVAGRWERTLEPSLAVGRVVSETASRRVFYTLAEYAAAPLPTHDSRLLRVEEAVSRAVTRHDGAVAIDAVREEFDRDAAIAIEEGRATLAILLQRLTTTGRIIEVRPDPRSARVYYTTLDGARQVAVGAEYAMERRRRAIISLWRLTRGRPFSTRAISRYSRVTAEFRIANDPPYGWTNSLQLLKAEGFVHALDDDDPYFRRWVLSRAWARLSPATQAERRCDPYGRFACTIPLAYAKQEIQAIPGTGMLSISVGDIDASAFSRNRDVALLVRLTQTNRRESRHADETHQNTGAEEGVADGIGRDGWLARRPVTERDVEKTLEGREHLLPAGIPLASALSEACRVRSGMVHAAVARVGIVRNRAYYTAWRAPDAIADAEAHVVWILARRAARSSQLQRMLRELAAATRLSAGRLVPLPPELLAARAGAIAAEARALAQVLTAAARGTQLLADEEASTERVVNGLRAVARVSDGIVEGLIQHDTRRHETASVARIAQTAQSAVAVWRQNVESVHGLLDISVAAAEIRALASYAMKSPREMWSRICQTIRIVRPAEWSVLFDGRPVSGVNAGAIERVLGPDVAVSPGRGVSVFMDRVGFGLYARIRWGGRGQRAFAAQSLGAVGSLRDAPLLTSLVRRSIAAQVGSSAAEESLPQLRTLHAATVCALAAFDDEASRQAVAAYLLASVETPEATTAAAVVLGGFGLRPAPAGRLTWALSELEQIALTAVARDHSDEYARRIAKRTLQIWQEGWPRERILAM